MMNNNDVVDFSIVLKMSEILNEYMRWKRHLWESDRKLYNKLKQTHKPMKETRESISHKVMTSNELYVTRAVTTLKDIKDCLNYDLQYDASTVVPLLDKVNALLVLIEITEHETSIFHR